MDSQFTPGPWLVHPLDRRAVCGSDGDSAIADIHTWRDTNDSFLIAQAPALYAFVESWLADFTATGAPDSPREAERVRCSQRHGEKRHDRPD